jgi:hypothetical protein
MTEFDIFLLAFPERSGGHHVEAARLAWGRALARAPASTIIAAAERYRDACIGKEPRYVMGAARWLSESRWREFKSPESGDLRSSPEVRGLVRPPDCGGLIWIEYGTREWEAWSRFYKATRGKTPPLDQRGGWRFPGPEPPS